MRLGIDIGGTKIEGALVTDKGLIIKKLRYKTESNKGRRKILKNLLYVIKSLDSDKVKKIGLSIAGIITKGKLVFSPNLKSLEGLNMSLLLEKKLAKKVLQENDANCFAVAEHMFGATKGYKNAVGLIIGTGIGGGIIKNDVLFKGKKGEAGEFGHTVFINSERFENLCSGPAIVKRYKSKGGKITNPNPKKIFSSKETIAKEIVKETHVYLAKGLSEIMKLHKPEIIVLGGGLSNLSIYRRLIVEVKKHTQMNFRIVKNKLGDSSGVIGAAMLR